MLRSLPSVLAALIGVLSSFSLSACGSDAAVPSGGGSGGSSRGGTSATGQGGDVGRGGSAEALGGSGTGGAEAGLGGASAGGRLSGASGSTGSGGGIGGAVSVGGTTTAVGGATSSGCDIPPPASELIGWAAVAGNSVATTTGGGDATPTVVTSLSQLQTAVAGTAAAVVYVKGVMAHGWVTVGSNKTIVGLCGAELHGHLELSGSVNVIVRNIKIVGFGVGNCALDPAYDSTVGCSSGDDAISVRNNAHHVWFDHCDIADGTDGNLDITNGSNYVTVSWTKFHYTPRTDTSGNDSTGAAGHRYSNLVGGTDTPTQYDDANTLNVTWHHNWWADYAMERMPRVRFGKNHILNNLWSSSGNNYCVRAGIQAHILIEGSVFTGVKSPHVFNSTADQATAYITADAAKNTYTSTSGTKATGGSGTPFTNPPYAYTMDALGSVESNVRSGAGPK